MISLDCPPLLAPSTPSHVRVIKATGTPATPTSTGSLSDVTGSPRLKHKLFSENQMIQDGLNSISTYSDLVSAETDKYTSVAPTMWLGSQSGR